MVAIKSLFFSQPGVALDSWGPPNLLIVSKAGCDWLQVSQVYYPKHFCDNFYVRKQLLLSAHLGHRNSVSSSVCHTGGSVKSSAS